MAIAAQKLIPRKLLTDKSFHINRDFVYDEMVSILFMNTIAKPRGKRLSET